MSNSSLEDWNKKGFAIGSDGNLKKLVPGNVRAKDKIVPDGSFMLPLGMPDQKPNAKVKNAVKSEVNGVKFDSNLEKYMYGLLKGAGITFDFQVVYVLQEKFRYNGEAVRAITLTVDFVLHSRNMIIDTKGYANDIAPLKYKMLKNYFVEGRYGESWLPVIELPSTKKECDLLLNRILYGK